MLKGHGGLLQIAGIGTLHATAAATTRCFDPTPLTPPCASSNPQARSVVHRPTSRQRDSVLLSFGRWPSSVHNVYCCGTKIDGTDWWHSWRDTTHKSIPLTPASRICRGTTPNRTSARKRMSPSPAPKAIRAPVKQPDNYDAPSDDAPSPGLEAAARKAGTERQPRQPPHASPWRTAGKTDVAVSSPSSSSWCS